MRIVVFNQQLIQCGNKGHRRWDVLLGGGNGGEQNYNHLSASSAGGRCYLG